MIKKIDSVLQRVPLLNIFTLKKTVEPHFLNNFGIQALRIKLAELRYGLRLRKTSNEVQTIIESLNGEGCAVIQDFLPEDIFLQLEKECHEALDTLPRSVIRQDGPNKYTNISIRSLGSFKTIMSVFSNDMIRSIFRGAERRNVELDDVTRLLSCLIQGEDTGIDDPETALHEDTFHNTFKAWLYITDVDYPQAPLVYVKGSHDNKRTMRLSKVAKYFKKKGAIKSRRISEKELSELGLEETHMLVKKNTLIVANTLGFHRRLRGEAGNKRIALAFSARFNPFI